MNTIRTYVNKFIQDDLLIRVSDKIRDAGALYLFKKY